MKATAIEQSPWRIGVPQLPAPVEESKGGPFRKEAREDPPAGEKPRPGGASLSEAEIQQLEELKQRDQEVKRHEQAHLSAAGSLASGGIRYRYQQGPDGSLYAVGGRVNLDVSPEQEPRETIAKARTIRRAALAPANPSAQDRSVASRASRMEAEARQELLRESSERMEEGVPSSLSEASVSQGAPAPGAGPSHLDTPSSRTMPVLPGQWKMLVAAYRPPPLATSSFLSLFA